MYPGGPLSIPQQQLVPSRDPTFPSQVSGAININFDITGRNMSNHMRALCPNGVAPSIEKAFSPQFMPFVTTSALYVNRGITGLVRISNVSLLPHNLSPGESVF